MTWVKKLFSGSDEASVKRVVYVLAGLLGGCYLGADLHNHGMTSAWITAFQTYMGFAGGGYTIGKAIEMMGASKGLADPTTDDPIETKAE